MPHEDALRNVELFSQLPSKDITRLGRAVVERAYKKGETIVKEGEQAVAFFIIVSGRVEVTQSGGSKKSQFLSELGRRAHSARWRCSTAARARRRSRRSKRRSASCCRAGTFVAELQTNPHMAVAMLPILSRRLRDVEAKLAATH